MTTSEIATLPGYEEFAPWLLVEKRGTVHVVSINRPEASTPSTRNCTMRSPRIWKVLDAETTCGRSSPPVWAKRFRPVVTW